MESLCKMTWEEMVEKYPGKWVAVTNYVKDGPDLVEGDLIAVLDDSEIDKFRLENWGRNYYYGRTTEESGVGIIHAKNFKLTVDCPCFRKYMFRRNIPAGSCMSDKGVL